MPEEVFKLWFDERITANRWPPIDPIWEATLRHRSFAEWQKFTWRKCLLSLDISMFNRDAVTIIYGLIAANVYGQSNRYTQQVPHTRKSFYHAYSQLRARGKFDQAVILISQEDVFDIADGCHRLAAFTAVTSGLLECAIPVEPLQAVWLGAICS